MFRKALRAVKLMHKRANLEQQIILLGQCLKQEVYPRSVCHLRLPTDLVNDTNLQSNIKRLLTNKLRRVVYSRKAACIREEADIIDSLRNHVHPQSFASILEVAQSEYTKQSIFHRTRCQHKFGGLILKAKRHYSSTQSVGQPNTVESAPVRIHPDACGSSDDPLYTNLTDAQLSEEEKNLLSKGPNFSLSERNKDKVIMDMMAGFQKMVHDIRWHCHHTAMAETHQHLNLNQHNKVEYPQVSSRKEISLPPLIPEVEDVIKETHHKYLNILKTIESRRLSSNLRPEERRAFSSLKSKGFKIVPSDKGGDLCVINQGEYDKAITEHLVSKPIYRRVTVSKISVLEDRVNEVWKNVCLRNKIPGKIKNMYASSCSNFACIQAVIKTHKSSRDSILIRPIINSVGSPGHNLSLFLQKILQPLISDVHCSSENILDSIKSLDKEILRIQRYPISLDVENMFHDIPREVAIEKLSLKLNSAQIDLCSIADKDLITLVSVCIGCNHFKHLGQVYFQSKGLPMGNRLSGVLAEVFMESMERETYATLNICPPAYRYVDDLLIFTKGEDEANLVNDGFNNNRYGIKFTMELPVEGEIPYLDFKVSISEEGLAWFDFYRKPSRKEVFLNASTSLPEQTINAVVKGELNRIDKRCSDRSRLIKHTQDYRKRLMRNGHNPVNIRRMTKAGTDSVLRENKKQEQTFFLNIPYVSNEVEHKIRKAIKGLGVRVHIAHKGLKMKHALKMRSMNGEKCALKNCLLNSNLCMIRGAIYEIKCGQCGAAYIGSSWRYLHTRYREHLTQKASPIYNHNIKCKGQLSLAVLATEGNIQNMRIKEAIYIKKRKPTLNVKDDLFKSHVLFDF